MKELIWSPRTLVTTGIIFSLIWLADWATTTNPRDNSDPVNGRSGLVILTDCLTGVQYVASPSYRGMTVRRGADGFPIVDQTSCK